MTTQEAVNILRKWDLGRMDNRRELCNTIADLLEAHVAECEAWRVEHSDSPCKSDPCPICTACSKTDDIARAALEQNVTDGKSKMDDPSGG